MTYGGTPVLRDAIYKDAYNRDACIIGTPVLMDAIYRDACIKERLYKGTKFGSCMKLRVLRELATELLLHSRRHRSSSTSADP